MSSPSLTAHSNGAITSKFTYYVGARCASDRLPSPSVTMGIRNMPFEDWIELDREFPQFHKVCDYRIRTRGDRLVSVQPAQPGVVASGQAAGALHIYNTLMHPDLTVLRICVQRRSLCTSSRSTCQDGIRTSTG